MLKFLSFFVLPSLPLSLNTHSPTYQRPHHIQQAFPNHKSCGHETDLGGRQQHLSLTEENNETQILLVKLSFWSWMSLTCVCGWHLRCVFSTRQPAGSFNTGESGQAGKVVAATGPFRTCQHVSPTFRLLRWAWANCSPSPNSIPWCPPSFKYNPTHIYTPYFSPLPCFISPTALYTVLLTLCPSPTPCKNAARKGHGCLLMEPSNPIRATLQSLARSGSSLTIWRVNGIVKNL